MTLLDRILERGYEMPIDPILVGRIERHIQRIKPDPLFQRRLRGQVVNRYVATREGMVAATRPVRLPRRSLSVLGRGMLYASLLTAVGTTAAGAAAQGSLPGDVLYGVKLELESIRMELGAGGHGGGGCRASSYGTGGADRTGARRIRRERDGNLACAHRSPHRADQHGAGRREAWAAAGTRCVRRIAVRRAFQPRPRGR
jgi:hypothetical protein